ncbi:MAG: ATP-binding protein, partial [Gemmatimonadota bacterium]|nr:ATP-binding protein [Gemmatimonadota bacterium]
MSYLRGPLTRSEIQRLSGEAGRASAAPDPAPASTDTPPTAAPTPAAEAPAAEAPPVLPPEIEQTFVPLASLPTAPVAYQPVVLGIGEFRVEEKRSGVRAAETLVAVAPLAEGPLAVDWERARALDVEPAELRDAPEAPARFGDVPAVALEGASWREWKGELEDWIHTTRSVSLFRSPSLGVVSEPGEDERDFRIRLGQLARERRDEEKAALERKYAPKIERLEERVRKAEQRLERESDQAREHKLQAVISIGATLLGSVLGRKAVSRSTLGKATTAARGIGRSMKQAGDVERAEETLASSRRRLEELDEEFRAEVEALDERFDPLAEELETLELRPNKSDVTVRHVSLGWLPEGEISGA